MATGQYDDAWETPGWTAQNLNYPPSDEETITVPEGLKAVSVTGQFFDQRGRPMWGVLTFTPNVRRVRVNNVTVLLREFKTQLRNGHLDNVSVLSPDVDAAFPPAWNWHIRQRIGPVTTEYDLPVPMLTDTVDVFDLQPVEGVTLTSDFPLIRDWTISAGATFRREFVWANDSATPMDQWTATLQIRDRDGALQLELTETSGITMTADGEINIHITDEQTGLLTDGTYGMEINEPGGDVTRFLQGTITVSPDPVT